MALNTEASAREFNRAKALFPGGVNSPVRAFKGVQGDPLFISRGEKSRLYDEDGNSYIDYVLSWGPLLAGHAHGRIVEAISQAAQLGSETACAIIEPVVGNMGVLLPKPGFLEALREETRRAGTLFICDEVMTGFRISRGGAQERYAIDPDLTCLGKVIGGGLPVGAYGGREEIMARVAPDGPIYQAV